MTFLSSIMKQTPQTEGYSSSRSSYSDLDISDDSVLDDLYTGLPPWYDQLMSRLILILLSLSRFEFG